MSTISRMSVLLIALLFAGAASADDFVVIVNEANKTMSLPARDVAAYFLKKKSQWGDGGIKVVPVMLSESNPATAAFDKQILNKSTAALRSFWQQEIFSGRNTPPMEKASDGEVVDFVRKNPGAIGFIGPGAAHDGVRTVTVTE